MKEKAWIVVANAEQAKVYRVVRVGQLQEVTTFEHPEGQMKGSDLTSDKPGRAYDRVGVARHAYEQKTSTKDKKDAVFAKHIAEYLTLSLYSKKYKNLYLICEPHFLGVLKKELPNSVQNSVDQCFSKDIVKESADAIWRHCPLVV